MVGVTYGLARYSYGLFLPYIQGTFSLDLQWLGVIGSSSYIGYLIATFCGSVIAGKIGPKIPLLLGGLCAVIGMLLVCFAHNHWVLLAGITIAGMSPGLAYPPLTDIVVLAISEKRRDTAFAVINAGTSFGVIVATPLALVAGVEWRMAWGIFAVISLIILIWNYMMAPSSGIRGIVEELPKIKLNWLITSKSMRLFGYAFFLGIVTSAFWTYSVEYIGTVNKYVSLAGYKINAHIFTKIFWSGVGISGLLGIWAGTFVNRYGLKLMVKLSMLAAVLATLVLVIFRTNGLFLLISSILFGAAFMVGSAYIGIWSINLFYDRPSAGMGAAFLLLSIGQMIGPIFFGIIAQHLWMGSIFYIAAILGIIATFIRPAENIYTMTPS